VPLVDFSGGDLRQSDGFSRERWSNVTEGGNGTREREREREREKEAYSWEEEQCKGYLIFLISTIDILCATCRTSKQGTGKLEEITTGADPNSILLI